MANTGAPVLLASMAPPLENSLRRPGATRAFWKNQTCSPCSRRSCPGEHLLKGIGLLTAVDKNQRNHLQLPTKEGQEKQLAFYHLHLRRQNGRQENVSQVLWCLLISTQLRPSVGICSRLRLASEYRKSGAPPKRSHGKRRPEPQSCACGWAKADKPAG